MGKSRNIADLLSSTGKVEADDLDVGQISGRRNLIINGAMQVSQRGASFTINSNQYTLDRWKTYQGANPASLTVSQETFAYNDAMVSEGFLNYMKVVISTGTGVVDTTSRMIRQKVEHPHRVAGKTLTYSFWIKSNSAASGNRYYIDMFLNTGSSQITYFDDQSLSGTVSTEWVRKSHTFTLPDATSAFTDSGYLEIMINPINDTAGDEYYITGAQLEVGSVATPFEHRSYGEELALCQRYYYKTGARALSLANATTAGYSYREPRSAQVTYPVEMRATPTATAVVSEASLSGGVLLRVEKEYVTCVPANYATDIPSGDYWYGGAVLDAEL